MLAYNLSPSFNWSAHGLSDNDIKNYTKQLASYGFVWQFITVAGADTPSNCFRLLSSNQSCLRRSYHQVSMRTA